MNLNKREITLLTNKSFRCTVTLNITSCSSIMLQRKINIVGARGAQESLESFHCLMALASS